MRVWTDEELDDAMQSEARYHPDIYLEVERRKREKEELEEFKKLVQ